MRFPQPIDAAPWPWPCRTAANDDGALRAFAAIASMISAALIFHAVPEWPLALALVVSVGGFVAHMLWHSHSAVRQRPMSPLAVVDDALAGGGAALLNWDVGAGRLAWSASFYDILGRPRQSSPMSLQGLRDLTHAEDDLTAALSSHLRAGSTGFQTTLRLRHADGDERFAALRGRIIRPFGARTPHVVAVLTDITDDHEIAARESHVLGRLREAVESTAESFVMWDGEDRLVACNRRFRELYRVPARLCVPGTHFKEMVAGAVAPLMQAPRTPAGTRKDAAEYEASLGPGCWLQIGERRTSDGGFVSVGTDISALKRSEKRASEKETALIAMVADLEASRAALEAREAALASLAEQLAEEKARAEDASSAKSQFLANISHELRTPLNAIIGFAEMLQGEVLGQLGHAKYREYAADIRDSGHHLRDVINDILDMARIEARRVTLAVENFPLSDLLTEAARAVAPQVEARGLTLHVQRVGGLALADRRALKQVLINLLSNAVKFTPEGGEVALRAWRYRGSLRIAVSDTGVGIARHNIARLGRPFEQVETQFSRSQPGTGLGLAISRALVELHGGRLDIKSRLGEGTVVTCILPAAAETEYDLAA